MAAIRLALNAGGTKRSKHIALRFHVVRELVAAGVVIIEHAVSAENVADIFTKALGRVKFHKFVYMLFGYSEVQEASHRVDTIVSLSGEYV